MGARGLYIHITKKEKSELKGERKIIMKIFVFKCIDTAKQTN